MINRTKEINRIIRDNDYQSYLEIGLGNGANFNAIECNYKIGVDPAVKSSFILRGEIIAHSSDTFFKFNGEKFDLIFIDGLHHAEQVERDILNAWKALNKGGQILIHDIRPLNEICQRVPRESIAWTGDVWRAWYGLKNNYTKLKLEYINERVGIGVIHKSGHKIKAGFVDLETTYKQYNDLKGWQI